MDSHLIVIGCYIVAVSILLNEIDTQTPISDFADLTTMIIENATSVLIGNHTDISEGTGGGVEYPLGALGAAIGATTKSIHAKTTAGPEDTNLPYTLVFYSERKRRRMYPQMAGYIIYRRKPFHREYLLFEKAEKPHHWTPPKADVQAGETHLERALKELERDSGLTSEDIIDVPMDKSNIRQYFTKTFRKGGKFFVGRIMEPNKEIRKCSRYIRYNWLDVEDAMAVTDEIGHLMHGVNKERRETVFFVGRLNNSEKRIRPHSKYLRYNWLTMLDAKAASDGAGARIIFRTDQFLETEGF